MNRETAYALMLEHTPSESLRRHMLNVEAAMRWYARHWAEQGEPENEELYAVAGLLHDFDYELHPEEHPTWGVNYLREHTDTPPEVLDAIEAGDMLFAIDQQQYLQGYLPIVLLTLYNTNLNTVANPILMTGPGFVTQDTAAQVKSLAEAGTR